MREFLPKYFNVALPIRQFLIELQRNEIKCPRLRLSANEELNHEAKATFCSYLRINTSTTSLILSPFILDKVQDRFLAALEKNTTLTSLSYDKSKFSQEENLTIQGYLARNRTLALEKEIQPQKVAYCPDYPYSLAWNAVHAGNINLLYSLLEDFPDLLNRDVDNLYSSLLHLAAKYGYIDCMKILIERGMNVNVMDNFYQRPPLSEAIIEDQYVAAQLLLKSNANVHLTRRGAPLFHDVNNVEMAQLLLDYGADIHAIDECGNSVLHNLASSGRLSTELMLFLLSKGAKVSAVNKLGRTVLHHLAMDSHVDLPEKINILLKAGINMVHTDIGNHLPLHLAHYLGSLSYEIIKKATRDYIHLKHAALLFSQAARTKHTFFSAAPPNILEKIGPEIVETKTLTTDTRNYIFKNYLSSSESLAETSSHNSSEFNL